MVRNCRVYLCQWINRRLSDKGTFYYKVITEDNWFEYSLSIYDLPTYTPSYNVGEKWIVDDKFEFTINNVEHHSVCTKKHESSANITTGAAIIINYTYKNLGNNKLTIDKWNFEVYDSSGIEGDSLYFCISSWIITFTMLHEIKHFSSSHFHSSKCFFINSYSFFLSSSSKQISFFRA